MASCISSPQANVIRELKAFRFFVHTLFFGQDLTEYSTEAAYVYVASAMNDSDLFANPEHRAKLEEGAVPPRSQERRELWDMLVMSRYWQQ